VHLVRKRFNHRQVLYQLRYSVDRDRTATLRAIEAYAGRPTACSTLPIAMQPQRWNTVGRTTDRAGRLPGARPCPGSGRRPKQDARPTRFLGRCPKQDARVTLFFGRCPKRDARPTLFLGRCSVIKKCRPETLFELGFLDSGAVRLPQNH